MAKQDQPGSATYQGLITDTSRWKDFQSREDDIFICTPPKCGTTWTQAICAMLIFGRADHGKKPNEISPWIDAQFEPLEVYLQKVEAQTHRRFIKTHSPFDGIPYFRSCTYLVVFRDPRDVYFSGLNHRDNMNNQDVANMIYLQREDPFNAWLHTSKDPNNWDIQCLDAFIHIYKSYWAVKDLGNVHLYHYSDMVNDLRSSIASMASAVSVSLSDAQLEEYVKAASFDAMKKDATRYVPSADSGFWKSVSGFFAKGSNDQWKNELSAGQNDAFLGRIAELLTDEEKHWLIREEN